MLPEIRERRRRGQVCRQAVAQIGGRGSLRHACRR